MKEGRAEASIFWNDFRDLIVYDFATSRNENVGRARTRGVELAWRQQVARPVGIDTGYTYLATEDRTTGERLLRRPRHRAWAAAILHPLPHLTTTLRALYVGARPDVDPVTFARVTNPSYTRLDLFARYDLRHLSPYLRVENATDEAYDEASGFPVPGLRVAAGLEARR